MSLKTFSLIVFLTFLSSSVMSATISPCASVTFLITTTNIPSNPNIVQISNPSSGITNFRIDWGDGTTPVTTAPSVTTSYTHSYSKGGYYSIYVIAEGNACSSVAASQAFGAKSVCASVTVNPPTTTIVGTTISTTVAVAAENLLTSFLLNWGDGTTVTSQRRGSTVTYSHSYSSAGSYSVQLQASGSNCVSASISNPVGVSQYCATAHFTNAVPSTSSSTQLMSITAASGVSGGVSYSINDGDGSPAVFGSLTSGQTLPYSASYTTPGSYTLSVTINANTAGQCTSVTYTQSVVVVNSAVTNIKSASTSSSAYVTFATPNSGNCIAVFIDYLIGGVSQGRHQCNVQGSLTYCPNPTITGVSSQNANVYCQITTSTYNTYTAVVAIY